LTPEAWKAWLLEKATLLECIAKWSQACETWKQNAHAWEAEAMKQARENALLRTLLKQRLQLVVEAMPEIS
jgi:hypothetical protein